MDSRTTSDHRVWVLIVDGDAATTSDVDRIVSMLGHSCKRVGSAEEAMATLKSETFELLISDVDMPGVSGLELLDQATKQDPDLAVIMISGRDDPSIAEAALEIGAFGYVVKPFETTELQIGVSNALRRRELEIAHRTHLTQLESTVQQRTDELRIREEQFRCLVQASPMGVLYLDETGVCEYANANAEVLLGRKGAELDQYRWMSGLSDSDAEAFGDVVRGALAGLPNATLQYELANDGGPTVWIRSQVAPVIDDCQGISGVVILFEDITSRKELEAQLRYQASHDHLTGLPNRRELGQQLDKRLRSLPQGEMLALLLIDLDHFKLVNDTHGHEVGDELIVRVAERLSRLVSGGVMVARLGGDEFVVVLSGQDRQGLVETAESIRSDLTTPTKLRGVQLSLGVSVGMAITGDTYAAASDLLRGADIAMHRAKAQRDSVVVYDRIMARGVARRLALTSDLRRAVDVDKLHEHQLTVRYQPIVNTQTRRLVGLEALARWTHPEWGPIAPDEFIPLAESVGLVHRIDHEILELAAGQLRRWRETDRIDPNVFMSVNVSASQLSNDALPDLVGTVLERVGLSARNLCLEMTEGTIIQDMNRTFPILQRLRALGVRIAIDDFGVGHSSLSYLTQLPVDILKVDRSFITSMGSDSHHLVEVIIDLAHRFDLAVVAEGVEDAQQLDALANLGCDMVQGFFTGRPVDAQDAALVEALADRGESAPMRSQPLARTSSNARHRARPQHEPQTLLDASLRWR